MIPEMMPVVTLHVGNNPFVNKNSNRYMNDKMKNIKVTNSLIASSMLQTIMQDSLESMTDIAEFSIDQVFSEGLLKDIPILNTIVGVRKCLNNVHDAFFVKKLVAFLLPIKDVDASKRREAINRWETNDRFRGNVGEALVGMIERCDDSFKAICLSKLFYELVLKRDKSHLFMRAEKVLSSLSVMDIQTFLGIPEESYTKITVEEHEPFVGTGLYQNPLVVPTTLGHIDFHNSLFEITEVGKWIYNVLNDIPIDTISLIED